MNRKTICSAIIIVAVLTAAYFNVAIADSNSELSDVDKLRSFRLRNLPSTISPTEPVYSLISVVGQSEIHKIAAAKELINWVFVKEPRPNTTEKFLPIDLYPAANAMIHLGSCSEPLLAAKLKDGISKEQAEILATSIKMIAKTSAPSKLREIELRISSQDVKNAIELAIYSK